MKKDLINRKVLILIALSAVILTATQGYFTYRGYKLNQQRFINDVQIALDNGIEQYYADLARSKVQVIKMDLHKSDTLIFLGHDVTTKITAYTDSISSQTSDMAHPSKKLMTRIKTSDTVWMDSMFIDFESKDTAKLQFFQNADVNLEQELKQLTNKVLLAYTQEKLNLKQLHALVNDELVRKNMTIEFGLEHAYENTLTKFGPKKPNALHTTSKSSYLGDQRRLNIFFENAPLLILKRGLLDLIITTLSMAIIIGTLIHLYDMIKKQKQLAEIKDDLISNITHEFKTPISTIFSAIEGIAMFNDEHDPKKADRYLDISKTQLNKLNQMVEKLLETATLEKGSLALNKEETELVTWTKVIVERFQAIATYKDWQIDIAIPTIKVAIDRFHLENVLANLIDNAIKYGGQSITIQLRESDANVEWLVQDNGTNIPKIAREKIFEKLYRIPTGNQHDVKGFGIGLYYAQSIAKLHGGVLELIPSTSKTIFRLSI